MLWFWNFCSMPQSGQIPCVDLSIGCIFLVTSFVGVMKSVKVPVMLFYSVSFITTPYFSV